MRVLSIAEKSLGIECQPWSEDLSEATVPFGPAPIPSHRTGRRHDVARVGRLVMYTFPESF